MPLAAVQRSEVVAFLDIVSTEVESTPGTLARLSLEEPCDLLRQVRVAAQPGGPVESVAVIHAFVVPDLDVAAAAGCPASAAVQAAHVSS
jgi:hypothetical protein